MKNEFYLSYAATPDSMDAKEAKWKITIMEVYFLRECNGVGGSFDVEASPSTSPEEFLRLVKEAEGNECRGPSTRLQPFNPSRMGTNMDDRQDRFVSDDPGGRPNCKWQPEKAKTIAEAGLCDGAILQFHSTRYED